MSVELTPRAHCRLPRCQKDGAPRRSWCPSTGTRSTVPVFINRIAAHRPLTGSGREAMPARQPIDPAWWNADHIDGVAMREALAERDIKTVFNFLHHRGWSWGAIAQATDIGE